MRLSSKQLITEFPSAAYAASGSLTVTENIYTSTASRVSARINMKLRTVIRPIVEVEYSTFRQRMIAYYVWLKFVILKSRVTIELRMWDNLISKHKCLVIPKYKFIKRA